MANTYNSKAFYQNQFRAITAPWESVSVTQRNSGYVYTQDILVNIAPGLTSANTDRIILMENPGSVFAGAAGLRGFRLYLANTVNVGGTTTFNLGWVNTSASAYGSALTTLQSATTLDVAIATMEACPDVLLNDQLALTIASAGPSTTASVLTGFFQFYFNRPV